MGEKQREREVPAGGEWSTTAKVGRGFEKDRFIGEELGLPENPNYVWPS